MFSINCIFIKNIQQHQEAPDLLSILGLSKDVLQTDAIKVIDYLEGSERNEHGEYNQFKWRILAFTTIQDVFEATIYNMNYIEKSFFQWYFYYETKYILTESILCGLNGFYMAVDTLLRLFLEFNLLQMYVYHTIRKNSDYSVLDNYFKNNVTPNQATLINHSLPSNSFTKPIKRRIDIHLKSLSKTALHPYSPLFSKRSHTGITPSVSLEGIYFWFIIDIILEVVLWLYYVNFPALFHPVDVIKKFGFNGPVGVFIPPYDGEVIRKSMSDADYTSFRNYAENNDDIKPLIKFYESKKDLTKEEIIATWNKEDGQLEDDFEASYFSILTKLRVIKESMVMIKIKELAEKNNKLPEVPNIFSYTTWLQLLKKIDKKNKKERGSP